MATAQDILNKYGLNSAPIRSADVLGKYGLLSDEEKKAANWAMTQAQPEVGPPADLAGPAGLGDLIGQSLGNTGRSIAAGAEQSALRAIPAAVDQANRPLLGMVNPLDIGAPIRALGERALGSLFSDEVEALRSTADTRLNEALPGLVAGEERMANLQRSRGNDFLGEAVGDIAGSATSALPLAAAAITGAVTRSPSAAATAARLTAPIPAVQAKAQAMLEAKRAGLSDAEAERYSNVVTGVEFATEALAPGPGSTVAGTIAKRVLGEQVSEQLATAGESGTQALIAPELAPKDAAEALERQRRTIAPALFFGSVTAPIGARAVTEQARNPVLPDTGDPAFDAGKNAAATLDTVADVQEAVQQPVTPKPRMRVVDGQLVPVEQSSAIPNAALGQSGASSATTVAPTATVDDSLVPASEADIAGINQQLTTEQQRTQNAEARNRVVKELTTAKDRTTAQNIERLIADGRIGFYGDQATLPEGANSATDKGYFDGQRIYLNESKLAEGEATSVALHEIKHYMDQQAESGGQTINRRSLRQFLGNEGNQRVNSRITELARTGNTIAKEALEDARFGATNNGQFDQTVFDDEVVPYFLQRMAAARSTGRPIVRRATEVVKDIISAAKAKIADFGIDLNLTENDILYLGKQLVGEAAKATQSGQSRAQAGQKGRATLVGPRAQNFQRYAEEGIVFQGALDNLPRAEIDDSRTRIRPEGKEAIQNRGSTFLGAFFEHPELYDNYPEMKRTRVRLLTPEEQKANPTVDGQAEAEDNTIAIHPRMLQNDTDLRRLLVHEGQHMIQEREGFIPGANPSEFMEPNDQASFSRAKTNIESFLNTVDRDVLTSIENQLPDSIRGAKPSRVLNAAMKLDPTLNTFSREERAALREYRSLLGTYTPLLEKSLSAMDKYRRTAGEVESRTVENRIGLTAGERRKIPFSESSERMPGGVRTADLVDNTNPASGSRFAGVRAANRERALSQGAGAPPAGRASRERPQNPQTETAAFKRWFGDSKVVDADGNPLVMYHGTSASEDGEAFTVFDAYGSNYGLFGQGSYFTDDPEVASSYVTKGRGKTPSVYPVYMSIQNPIDMDAQAHLGGMHAKWRDAFPEIDFQNEYKPVKTETTLPNGNVAKGATNEAYYRQVEEYFKDNEWIAYEAAEAIQDGLRKMGFDGITHIGGGRVKSEGVRHKVFIAFEPDQIKSAISNNGDFDPKRADMRASKTRPEQPERVRKRLGGAGVDQPTSRRAPVPTQARGVVPERESARSVEERTVPNAERSIASKLKVAGEAALSAVAPSTRGKAADVNEIMERSLGEATESKVRAAQALNSLEKSVNRVPKTQRNVVKRQLALASSSDASVRNGAIESLKKNHPAVYANYDSMRNQIRQWGLDAVVSIRDSGRQLTKRDVAVITKILKNLDSYVTRTYRVDYKGPIAEQLKKDTLGAWSRGDRTSEGAKAFEEAKQYLRNTLQIGEFSGLKNKKPEDYDYESLEKLEALHAEWVSRENTPTLFADATDVQRETYINTLLSDLQQVRKDMPEAEYLQKLDDKALRLTKELIDTVNTNSSKLVQFFRGARQDNTIVSTRADVPEPIRKLWGEITEPTAALAITMMRQGEFLARQKMLRELYDTGLGRYFVDQKDARSDVFTERLQGETFGPLDGMYATPSFKKAVESNIEPLNSWKKVFDAMTQGKADIATQAAAGQSIAVLSYIGAKNKKATVIWNPASWVNNFLGGPATPIMQGFLPGKGLARGVKAAKDLIGPSFDKYLSEEGSRVLKANLQESGQVGEIQQAQKDIIQNLLLDDGALGALSRAYTKADTKLVDAYAMTDVVWKLSTFFAKVDWLKDYYKAKGVTRTPEQIDREAAEYVKPRAITFSRAAPLVKFTERLGLTSYAPYFYETYRTLGASLIGAAKYIQDGKEEGGPAGAMKVRLGVRAAVGATSALFYNRAILPAYEVAGAVALAGMAGLGAMEPPDEEEQEKLDVIRKGMSDFYVGKELTLWRKTDDGKYIFIEPGRVNPNDPATSPMAALMSGDPDTALKAISGLFFGNQGIAAVLGVGGEFFSGDKAKKPSAAYNTPETYEKMVDTLQNSFLGVSPDTTAQVTRVLEKYIPKVARTTLREATEDTGLTGTDKFLAAMGQPFAIFDPKKDIRMSGFRDYNDPVDKAKEDFKTAITTRNPSDEVIKDAYLRSLKMEHKAYTRMREVVEAAKAAGMNNQAIAGILKDENGLNKAQISSLLSGRFQPTFISPTSVSNARKEEIKADPTKASQIQSKYTRIDKVIRSTNKEFQELLSEEMN